MQSLTEKMLRMNLRDGLFDRTVLTHAFPTSSSGARQLLLNRALKRNEVARVAAGVYCLEPPFRSEPPHPFVVALMIHPLCHVSLESALAWHRLIPEAVYQVSCVTVRRSVRLTTPLGVFDYRCVPARSPFAGVESAEVAKNRFIPVATPLRALADLVYLRNVTWDKDGAGFLLQSLRLEPDDLARMDFSPLDEITASLKSKRVGSYLQCLKKEVTAC